MSFFYLFSTTYKNSHKRPSFPTSGWFMSTVVVHNKSNKVVWVSTYLRRKISSVSLNTTSVHRKCPSSYLHFMSYQSRERKTNSKYSQPSIWYIKKQQISPCSNSVKSPSQLFISSKINTVRPFHDSKCFIYIFHSVIAIILVFKANNMLKIFVQQDDKNEIRLLRQVIECRRSLDFLLCIFVFICSKL